MKAKTSNSFVTIAILCAVGVAAAIPSFADITLTPTSYTLTPGEAGGLTYYDDTGSQLTDGVYGADDIASDLGNGPGYEWVGWETANPTAKFQFADPITVHEVGIDFNRAEGNYGIYLPNTVVIGGTTFDLVGDEIADQTRGTLYFDGNWSGTSLNVHMGDEGTGPWIFTDEMTFSGVEGISGTQSGPGAVPEPSAALTTGFGVLGLMGLMLVARKRTASPLA